MIIAHKKAKDSINNGAAFFQLGYFKLIKFIAEYTSIYPENFITGDERSNPFEVLDTCNSFMKGEIK